MTHALLARGLGKRYRSTWALRDCDLALPAGRVIALVGPNGAGKTTLLRLCVGLLAPTTGSVALSVAFSGIVSWYRVPIDVLYGKLGQAGFDIEGIVPAAYALFAFALAAVAGALLRRSIAGLAVALIVFVVVRVAVAGFLRPEFATPQTLIEAIPDEGRGVQIGTDRPSDWVLAQNFLDRSGNTLDGTDLNQMNDAALKAGMNVNTYLHDQGIQRAVSFHPAERFWDFQFIEAGLFVGLAALLLAAVVWRVKRRAL